MKVICCKLSRMRLENKNDIYLTTKEAWLFIIVNNIFKTGFISKSAWLHF